MATITFKYTDDDFENMKVVMEEAGVTNKTQAIKHALAFSARKLRPSYVNTGPTRTPMTDEERTIKATERIANEKRTRALLNKQRGDELCALLGGEARQEPETGAWACYYPIYKLEERHESAGGSFVEKWTDKAFYANDINEKTVESQYREDGSMVVSEEKKALMIQLIEAGKVKEV